MASNQVGTDSRVADRARLLVSADPGLSPNTARRRAIEELQMFDDIDKVDPNSRSGMLHIMAVARIRAEPGLSYRDAVFAASKQLLASGRMPRHESGAV